jgi:hypothetical protein
METNDEDDGIDPVPNIDTPGCAVALVVIAASAAIGATLARYVAAWLAQ